MNITASNRASTPTLYGNRGPSPVPLGGPRSISQGPYNRQPRPPGSAESPIPQQWWDQQQPPQEGQQQGSQGAPPPAYGNNYGGRQTPTGYSNYYQPQQPQQQPMRASTPTITLQDLQNSQQTPSQAPLVGGAQSQPPGPQPPPNVQPSPGSARGVYPNTYPGRAPSPSPMPPYNNHSLVSVPTPTGTPTAPYGVGYGGGGPYRSRDGSVPPGSRRDGSVPPGGRRDGSVPPGGRRDGSVPPMRRDSSVPPAGRDGSVPPASRRGGSVPPRAPSSTGLIRLTLRKPMGIVFEPIPVSTEGPSTQQQRGVRICDLPRTGAAALSRKLEVGDELLSINDRTMSRLTFDEIMDFIIEADPERVQLLFRRPRKEAFVASAVVPGVPSVSGASSGNSAPSENKVKWIDEKSETGDGLHTQKTTDSLDKESSKYSVEEEGNDRREKEREREREREKERQKREREREREREKERRYKETLKKRMSEENRRRRQRNKVEAQNDSLLDIFIDTFCTPLVQPQNSPCVGNLIRGRKAKGQARSNDVIDSDEDEDEDTYVSHDDSTFFTYESSTFSENKKSRARMKRGADVPNGVGNSPGSSNKENHLRKGGKGKLGNEDIPEEDEEDERTDEGDNYSHEEDDTLETEEDRAIRRKEYMEKKFGVLNNDPPLVTHHHNGSGIEEKISSKYEPHYDEPPLYGAGDDVPANHQAPYEDDATLETVETSERRKQTTDGSYVPQRPLGLSEPTPPPQPPPPPPSQAPSVSHPLPIQELEYNLQDGDVSIMSSSLQGVESYKKVPAILGGANAAEEYSLPGMTVDESIQKSPTRFYRHVVQHLLETHEPEKVRLLDKLLAKYQDREEHLIQKLTIRYNRKTDSNSPDNNTSPPTINEDEPYSEKSPKNQEVSDSEDEDDESETDEDEAKIAKGKQRKKHSVEAKESILTSDDEDEEEAQYEEEQVKANEGKKREPVVSEDEEEDDDDEEDEKSGADDKQDDETYDNSTKQMSETDESISKESYTEDELEENGGHSEVKAGGHHGQSKKSSSTPMSQAPSASNSSFEDDPHPADPKPIRARSLSRSTQGSSYASDDYSGSSIDGTSPAVIAQVSELLNFVYGKTSVPGQIDRVSTIMRAYEGRESVLLELLETKALIKANAQNVVVGDHANAAGDPGVTGEPDASMNNVSGPSIAVDADRDDISSVSAGSVSRGQQLQQQQRGGPAAMVIEPHVNMIPPSHQPPAMPNHKQSHHHSNPLPMDMPMSAPSTANRRMEDDSTLMTNHHNQIPQSLIENPNSFNTNFKDQDRAKKETVAKVIQEQQQGKPKKSKKGGLFGFLKRGKKNKDGGKKKGALLGNVDSEQSI